MTAPNLLSWLSALGVSLSGEGGRLRVDAPTGVIGPDLRAKLSAHKAELIALLSGEKKGCNCTPFPNPPASEPTLAPVTPPQPEPTGVIRVPSHIPNYPAGATLVRTWRPEDVPHCR